MNIAELAIFSAFSVAMGAMMLSTYLAGDTEGYAVVAGTAAPWLIYFSSDIKRLVSERV